MCSALASGFVPEWYIAWEPIADDYGIAADAARAP
jgi:hypothetical protein